RVVVVGLGGQDRELVGDQGRQRVVDGGREQGGAVAQQQVEPGLGRVVEHGAGEQAQRLRRVRAVAAGLGGTDQRGEQHPQGGGVGGRLGREQVRALEQPGLPGAGGLDVQARGDRGEGVLPVRHQSVVAGGPSAGGERRAGGALDGHADGGGADRAEHGGR